MRAEKTWKITECCSGRRNIAAKYHCEFRKKEIFFLFGFSHHSVIAIHKVYGQKRLGENQYMKYFYDNGFHLLPGMCGNVPLDGFYDDEIEEMAFLTGRFQ